MLMTEPRYGVVFRQKIRGEYRDLEWKTSRKELPTLVNLLLNNGVDKFTVYSVEQYPPSVIV